MNEFVVLERVDHEHGEVHAAGHVALENGISDVSAPDRQALALALLEIAAAYHGPARVARKNSPARLYLVVEVGEASESRKSPADRHERFELPRVHVLAVEADVPPAREHQPGPGRRVVEHR